jgi:hypothetical protein
VFEEGFEVVPPAPVTDEQRADALAFQLRRPRSAEVVEHQMRPTRIFSLGEALSVGSIQRRSVRVLALFVEDWAAVLIPIIVDRLSFIINMLT